MKKLFPIMFSSALAILSSCTKEQKSNAVQVKPLLYSDYEIDLTEVNTGPLKSITQNLIQELSKDDNLRLTKINTLNKELLQLYNSQKKFTGERQVLATKYSVQIENLGFHNPEIPKVQAEWDKKLTAVDLSIKGVQLKQKLLREKKSQLQDYPILSPKVLSILSSLNKARLQIRDSKAKIDAKYQSILIGSQLLECSPSYYIHEDLVIFTLRNRSSRFLNKVSLDLPSSFETKPKNFVINTDLKPSQTYLIIVSSDTIQSLSLEEIITRASLRPHGTVLKWLTKELPSTPFNNNNAINLKTIVSGGKDLLNPKNKK